MQTESDRVFSENAEMSPMYNEPMIMKSPEVDPTKVKERNTTHAIQVKKLEDEMPFYQEEHNPYINHQQVSGMTRNRDDPGARGTPCEISPERPRSSFLRASQKMTSFSLQ